MHPKTYLHRFLLFLPLLLSCSEPPPGEGASVLVLSADSLRVDRLPIWGVNTWNVDAPATPNLDRLAARGTVYLNAWSASPWTAPSMVSVLSGLYPPSHGIVYRDDTTPTTFPTLPRLLAARGHELGNFSFFSEVSYFRNLGLGSPIEGLRHQTVAESFHRWLAEVPAERPFFAWVHLLETHLPYGATGYRTNRVLFPGSSGLELAQTRGTVPVGTVEFADGDRERLRELYDRDVVALDVVVGKVLAALEEEGRLDRTVLVFVADHGEELFERGWIGHASTAAFAKLVPEILRVPLIVAGPGVPAGGRRTEMVQQVDVVPTVLRLLGAEMPEPLDGELLPGIFSTFWGDPGKGRDFAFFDSAPGGNLTPQDRRDERLQGVTDGRCVLEVHAFPDRAEEVKTYTVPLGGTRGGDTVGDTDCPADAGLRLRDELEIWRRRQAEQRLAVLASAPGESAPPSAEIDTYDEAIELVTPRPGTTLEWGGTQGRLTFEWTATGSSFWIEYRLGDGLTALEGSFRLDQKRIVFGPVPQGFWDDLAVYTPYRVRIVDVQNLERSEWVEFEVRKADG